MSGEGEAAKLRPVAACKCGPGFCAADAGVGYYGVCGGSDGRTAAPDCALCGAPHQSDQGCWACAVRGGNDPDVAKLAVGCLRAGITYDHVFAAQEAYFDATGNFGLHEDFLPGGELAGWLTDKKVNRSRRVRAAKQAAKRQDRQRRRYPPRLFSYERFDRADGSIIRYLWLGWPWSGPGISLEITRHAGFGCTLTFGGDESDGSLWFGLGAWGVSFHAFQWLPGSWRARAYTWATRRAADLSRGVSRTGCPVYPHELDPFEGRETGFYWVEGMLVVKLWGGDAGWSAEDARKAPWNGNGWITHLNVVGWIRGEGEVTREPAEVTSTPVIMPEGLYEAVVTMQRHRTAYRFYTTPWAWRVSIEIIGGIPLPGKGENEYDLDDDAVYVQTSGTQDLKPTAEGVAAALASEILQDRVKLAGPGWVPAGGWPAHCSTRPPAP